MTIQMRPFTAEDLLRMPDDGSRYELIEGELRQMVPAGGVRGYLALRIASRLERHVDAENLGRTYAAETGFKISSDPDTVRAPDAAFVRRERVEMAGRVRGYWPGAPDLAVEVVSPNDTHSEVIGKVLAWLEAGSRMVLVVDPEKLTITVYRSRDEIRVLTASAGDTIDGADVVPGWTLPVAELFA